MVVYKHLRDPREIRAARWRVLESRNAKVPVYYYHQRRIHSITKCIRMPPAVRQFYNRLLLSTPMPRIIHGMFANAA
jgi:hypothetical protein